MSTAFQLWNTVAPCGDKAFAEFDLFLVCPEGSGGAGRRAKGARHVTDLFSLFSTLGLLNPNVQLFCTRLCTSLLVEGKKTRGFRRLDGTASRSRKNVVRAPCWCLVVSIPTGDSDVWTPPVALRYSRHLAAAESQPRGFVGRQEKAGRFQARTSWCGGDRTH